MRKGLPKIKTSQGRYQGIKFDHHFLVEKPIDVLFFAKTSSWDKKMVFEKVHI